MPDDPEDEAPSEGFTYPIYEGDLDCCAHCGRKFQWADIILVSLDEQLTFCFFDVFSEESEPTKCHAEWVLKNSTILLSKPYRFGGE